MFALPTMAPLHIGLLQQLGRRVDVHVYVLNPCREYWFEVVAPRQLSHLAARGRDQGHEVGNRLLAAWGRQTQSHIDTLVDRAGEAALDDSHRTLIPPRRPATGMRAAQALRRLDEVLDDLQRQLASRA